MTTNTASRGSPHTSYNLQKLSMPQGVPRRLAVFFYKPLVRLACELPQLWVGIHFLASKVLVEKA